MRHSEALFETIANYTYDWESWIGLDGRPLWINPAVERMTGYSVDECLRMADYPLDLVDETDRERIAEHLRSALAGTSGNDVEFRIRRRDGRDAWGAVSWQLLYDETRQVLGVRTSVREITQRKQIEAELRSALDQTQRANLAKSRFLAAASHDLRQPLQAAALFASVLRRRVRDPASTEIVDSIRTCLEASNSLLDSLLDISRLEAGVLRVELRDFPASDLLDRIVDEFGPIADEHGVRLATVATSAAVHTDPVLFLRILNNLVSNAIRYKRGGRVLVGARRHGAWLRFEVWDNGIGIEEDQLEAIFEEFYQIGNQERDREKGLGLGLAIVQRIAGILGIEISVRSWVGRGSVFTASVPLSQAEPPLAHAKPSSSRISLAGLTVAAIEDEALQLLALERFFTAARCHVVGGKSAAECLTRLRARNASPDVIIADYRLGDDVTGIAAVQAVRDAFGREIPAVLVTGDTEPARLAEAAASGLPMLYKPVEPARLLEAVATLLGRSPRQPRPAARRRSVSKRARTD